MQETTEIETNIEVNSDPLFDVARKAVAVLNEMAGSAVDYSGECAYVQLVSRNDYISIQWFGYPLWDNWEENDGTRQSLEKILEHVSVGIESFIMMSATMLGEKRAQMVVNAVEKSQEIVCKN